MARSDARLTVPEAARRLGLPGGDVYRLIFSGELAGGPDDDGSVYVSVESVELYLSGAADEAARSYPMRGRRGSG